MGTRQDGFSNDGPLAFRELGRVDKPNPDPDGCQNNKGREALDEFAVAGRDAS